MAKKPKTKPKPRPQYSKAPDDDFIDWENAPVMLSILRAFAELAENPTIH